MKCCLHTARLLPFSSLWSILFSVEFCTSLNRREAPTRDINLVTYALPPTSPSQVGNGFVDVFDTTGHLIRRLISRGPLDAPWGLVLAPARFGRFSKALLVGNLSNGYINAFNFETGAFRGTLESQQGQPIQNLGLWALTFGNGSQGFNPDTLYFDAGIDNFQHGLFGAITPGS